MDNTKINKIINAYGKIMEKYAGYSVINEEHLTHKKDDIRKAIMVSIGATIQAKQNPEVLITGYMELGLFQKYQDVDSSDLMDPDPKKYLAKRTKHKKMIEKANAESKKLLTEIRGWEKTMRKKFK